MTGGAHGLEPLDGRTVVENVAVHRSADDIGARREQEFGDGIVEMVDHEGVAPRSAIHDVSPGATVEAVVAIAAEELVVVARAAVQGVVADEAAQDIDPAIADDALREFVALKVDITGRHIGLEKLDRDAAREGVVGEGLEPV